MSQNKVKIIIQQFQLTGDYILEKADVDGVFVNHCDNYRDCTASPVCLISLVVMF